MPLEFDHLFVCCSPGAPEADLLLDSGFNEGHKGEIANQHCQAEREDHALAEMRRYALRKR
jgi:hypothetical protein